MIQYINIITLLFVMSLNAQNLVIDCVYTLETEQFKTVSDTLKGYNGVIMMQSKSGFKLKYVQGDVTFIHGLLARETTEDYSKPYLYIKDCNNKVKVSSRLQLEVGTKNCRKKIEIIEQ